MTTLSRSLVLSLAFLCATTGTAIAQSATPAGSGSDGWAVAIYPVLGWVPTSIEIDTNLPPADIGGGGSGGSGGGNRGKVVDPRFDGAVMGGFSVAHSFWRADADVVWAAVGGDRIETPRFSVDVNLLYAHASAGIRIVKDVYVTGGVRRMALTYDFKVPDGIDFTRKPGVWDPVVGVGYHHVGPHFEMHGTFEGGGFGVGSDSEYAASLRADWKPAKHFGLTAGYSFLKFTVSSDILDNKLVARQTLHGPVVGIGLYF